MTFITVDSKLTFDKHYLNIKKVAQKPTRSYWFDSFLLLALFIGFQAYRAIYDKPRAWVLVLIGLTWIYPHLERIFKILFIYKWGNRIKLDKIVKYAVLTSDNDLETTLQLKLVSGRQKLLLFRSAENQIDDFLKILHQKAVNLKGNMAAANMNCVNYQIKINNFYGLTEQ
jgi:hypothetical protein